jgi:hypothetical protein
MRQPRTMIALIAGAILLLGTSPLSLKADRHQPCCGEITAAGRRLAGTLDGMNVKSL